MTTNDDLQRLLDELRFVVEHDAVFEIEKEDALVILRELELEKTSASEVPNDLAGLFEETDPEACLETLGEVEASFTRRAVEGTARVHYRERYDPPDHEEDFPHPSDFGYDGDGHH